MCVCVCVCVCIFKCGWGYKTNSMPCSCHICKYTLLQTHLNVCACLCMQASGRSSSKLAMFEFPYSISCLHTAPSQCPTVSGHWITPRTDSVIQQTAGSTAAQHFYLLSLLSFKPDNISTCIKLKLFFPPCIMYWLLPLWCEDSPESRAFLDDVSSLKKLRRVSSQTKAH